jgi:small GTP-binding protein
MISKKICMVGAFAVGKTSLVARFVDNMYSDKYQTTVGVKISKKALHVDDQEWHLLLWDLAGEDDFMQIRTSYLRGSHGYLLVVDGTRRATLDMAVSIQQRIVDAEGAKPFVVLFNKSDLTNEWDMPNNALEELSHKSWPWLKASAKTGIGVDEAFLTLIAKLKEG